MQVAIVGRDGLVARSLARRLLAQGTDVVYLDPKTDLFPLADLDAALPCAPRDTSPSAPRVLTDAPPCAPSSPHEAEDVPLLPCLAPGTGYRGTCDGGFQTIVYLAPSLDGERVSPAAWREEMRGLETLLLFIAAARIPKLIFLSSALVYGAHPDQSSTLLTEDTPVRPNLEMAPAERCAEAEARLCRWQDTAPDVQVTLVRPAAILGAGLQNSATRVLISPFRWGVSNYAPAMQFVHIADLVSALAHFLENDCPGVFNVCADGALSRDELLTLTGQRLLSLPASCSFPLADLADLLTRPHRRGEAAAIWLAIFPLLLSNAKAKATGWSPRHTNASAVTAALATISTRPSPRFPTPLRTQWPVPPAASSPVDPADPAGPTLPTGLPGQARPLAPLPTPAKKRLRRVSSFLFVSSIFLALSFLLSRRGSPAFLRHFPGSRSPR